MKSPHFFQVKDKQFFCFAGIYEVAKIGEQTFTTCAILTTIPNELVEPIHNRMPVILRPEDYGLWCDPTFAGANVTHLLGPFPAEQMTVHPVNRDVSLRVDSESCIEPVNSL
jgi:putative SOS response-associated peptidase YedK